MTAVISLFVSAALAVFPFAVLFSFTVGSSSGDTLDVMLAKLASGSLLLSLFAALLFAAIHNGIPRWSAAAALIVVPMCWLADVAIPEVLKDGAGRWMIAIALLHPLLLLAYIGWIVLPPLRAMYPPNLAAGVVWGSIFVLALIPLSMNVSEAERVQKRVAARQAPAKKRLAQFDRLPPDAPVRDLIRFVIYDETKAAAMQRIRAAKNREAELAQLVNNGDELAFAWLTTFNVTPAPVICDSVRKFLRDRTAAARRTRGSSIAGVDQYVATLTWAAKNKCPMLPELSAYIAVLRLYYPNDTSDNATFEAIAHSLQD